DLAHGIAKRAGVSLPAGLPQPTQGERAVEELEVRLWAARGKSLVVSSLQHVGAQVALAFINDQLGSYGTTIDIENPIRTRQGNDADLLNLIADMKAEKVKTLIVHDLNPVFDLPDGKGFANALKKVPFVVSTVSAPNEMSMAAKVVCPEPHFLERWDDSMPVPGVLCLTQPALSPTFKTRTFRDSLATWMDLRVEDSDYRKSYFEKNVDWRSGKHKTFNAFWTSAIHDGVAAVTPTSNSAAKFKKSAFAKAAWPTESVAKGFELLVYEKAGMPSSRHAHNAWLQELPDPMTKICWGNVALLGVVAAEEMEVEDGDVVSVKVGSQTIELPAKIQPGQHERVVAIALGYGRSGTERFEKIGPDWLEAKPTTNDKGLVGTNVAPLRSWAHGLVQRSGAAQVSKTKKHSPLAVSQSWSSIDLPAYTHPGTKRRNGIVEETTTGELLAQGEEAFAQHHTNDKDLWADDHANGHPQWGMSIDLSQCTGCSACVISCQVENNIPVVGKDEVRRKRDMQWMRIDRYYSGNPKSPTEVDVVHQPMMCQHCGNAPCETVCPVLATVHSEEGLNQQIYNRCVGTRYCANNCPYKVRRFNWFDYSRTNLLENMVLNPDIAVRSRGVMEKCSFCVQRIQEAKTEAKRLGIKVPDGAVQPACAQACPTEAITFGDRTKKENAVAKAMADPLNYKVLESLNVKPAVGYRRLVRNRNEERK
ncbi:MAG: Fe-S-cluster-containing dehydrogenase component, partial [Planctomycetota bacterium]